MLSTHKLFQHAFDQPKVREARQTIPACSRLESYPSMQLANQKPGKLDMLSQHAVEANHNMGQLDTLSQHTQCKHVIPAYIV